MSRPSEPSAVHELGTLHVVLFNGLAIGVLIAAMLVISLFGRQQSTPVTESDVQITEITLADLPTTTNQQDDQPSKSPESAKAQPIQSKPAPKSQVPKLQAPKPPVQKPVVQKIEPQPKPVVDPAIEPPPVELSEVERIAELPEPIQEVIPEPEREPELVPAEVVNEEPVSAEQPPEQAPVIEPVTAASEPTVVPSAPASESSAESSAEPVTTTVSRASDAKLAEEAARSAYYPKLGAYLRTYVLKEYQRAEAKGHSAVGETIQIEYTVDRQGNLLDYRLVKRPKSNQVARAVRRGIKAAAPFPAIPADMPDAQVTRLLTVKISPPPNVSH